MVSTRFIEYCNCSHQLIKDTVDTLSTKTKTFFDLWNMNYSRYFSTKNIFLRFKGIDQCKGWLNLVSFDLSRFKLFTLKFSKESVQTSSCNRPKTAQRILFLSFEINNYFPITVQLRRMMKKSAKHACHVVNSNIAVDSLATLQISLGNGIALFERIYDGEPILTVISNIGKEVHYRNTVVSINWSMPLRKIAV